MWLIKSMPGSWRRALEPDQRSHAPGDAVPAERIERLGQRIGAAPVGMDRTQPECRQTLARQPMQIALPAAAGIGCERRRGLRVALTERRAHLLAHFIVSRPDGRSEAGQ